MSESNNTSLALFSRGAQMLAEADTIQKTKELKDIALTAADWAKRKDLGDEAIQYARAYAIRAEYKLGELLALSERAPAGRPAKLVTACNQLSDPPTLTDLGLSKRESSNAQRLHALGETTREELCAGEKTRTEALRLARRESVCQKIPNLPKNKYRVIYADPPWKYGDSRASLDGTTGASAHYPSMSIADLCALPISEIAAENAVLFMWTTSPLLYECEPVFKAWGFEYKACFVWDKVKHNLGHYNSVRHEFLLVCTRGSCLPDIPKLFDSVVSIERSKKHSEKPNEFRELIDQLYPHGSRIELFARESSPGWVSYGNQKV